MTVAFRPFSSQTVRCPLVCGPGGVSLALPFALLILTLVAPSGRAERAAPAPAAAAAVAAADPAALAEACAAALAASDQAALRLAQQTLLQPPARPESLAPLLARAELLLSCRAPGGALQVLDRLSPAAGADRRAWLLQRWQAAAAALNHRLAADSLVRLAEGNPAGLETLQLPVLLGSPVRRPALDLLADHLEALGWGQRAAEVLLSAQGRDAAAAARLGRAVALAEDLPRDQRRRVLERALEQAAEAGAWGLVADLLDLQWAGLSEAELAGSDLAVQRRLRLSGRIDDAYGEWRLRRRLAEPQPSLAELERQLRSPRSPGGHASPSEIPALP